MTKPLKSFTILEVDAEDDTVSRLLRNMHGECFVPEVKLLHPEDEFWFIAWDGDRPAAFAGLGLEDDDNDTGYLCRSGVLASYRGHGLQLRLIRRREAKAIELGLNRLVSDTTGNVPSSNNLIRAGFHLFEPARPWAFDETLYWEKEI